MVGKLSGTGDGTAGAAARCALRALPGAMLPTPLSPKDGHLPPPEEACRLRSCVFGVAFWVQLAVPIVLMGGWFGSQGSLLASEERAWLASYQAQVMERLGPRLDARRVPYLERCCQLP